LSAVALAASTDSFYNLQPGFQEAVLLFPTYPGKISFSQLFAFQLPFLAAA